MANINSLVKEINYFLVKNYLGKIQGFSDARQTRKSMNLTGGAFSFKIITIVKNAFWRRSSPFFPSHLPPACGNDLPPRFNKIFGKNVDKCFALQ